jgi:pyruvate dehydrogenase E2 component (dihydrolipoamide acetyltransferase)
VARLLLMPEVATGGEEAVLLAWPVAEQVPFAALDTIATVETEKAVVDVPADAGGVILKTLVAEGAHVAVGDPIAVLGELGERVPELSSLIADVQESGSPPVAGPPFPASAGDSQRGRVFSSPLARRMAKEAGLVLAELRPTGPGGRVVRRDVLQALSAAASAVTSASGPGANLRSPAEADFTDLPHSPMRRAIARRLTQSVQEAPQFTVHAAVRVDKLLRVRAELNSAPRPAKISLNDLVVAAVAKAHRIVPEMNVVWLPDATRLFAAVDVALAVATERGLLTPVLREADRMSVSQIAVATADLVTRARAGTLRQSELEGGSISVSNLGGYGVEAFTAVLNPPQAAILAVGQTRKAAVVVNDAVTVASVMNVSLSVDHRPVDGAVAARWMSAFVALVEEPVNILA